MSATNKNILHKKDNRPKFNLKKIAQDTGLTQLILWFFVAFSRGKATWFDIPLSGLVLVVIAAGGDILQKGAALAGAVSVLGVCSISQGEYIPYLLAVIIYVAAYNAVKNEKYSLLAALFFMATGRIILAPPGSNGNIVYTLLECAAVYLLREAVKNTGNIWDKTISGSVDIMAVFTTLLAVTLALSGTDSRIIYTGGRVALALSRLWQKNGDYILSLTALLCFFCSICDKRAFTFLFAGSLVVWLIWTAANVKDSLILYPAVTVSAVLFNIAFLRDMGGFALTGTVIFRLIIYKVLPGVISFGTTRPENVFADSKDYYRLANSMRKLEQSLSFLGNCAIDISRLNEKNLSAQSLEDTVAEDVCRKCANSSYCWQEKYSFTAAQFEKYAKSMNWARERGFDMAFYSHCSQVDKLKASFEENYRLQLSRRYIMQSQKNNQKLLQTAFMSVSRAVGDMLYANNNGKRINSAFTLQLDRFLDSLGIKHTYCLCGNRPDKADFGRLDPVESVDIYKIKTKLERIYGESFTAGEYEKQGREWIYTFYATPKYTFDYDVQSAAFRDINGDGYAVFAEKGDLYVLLSDGMGTGRRRAAESRTVIAMAESLLVCGVSLHSVMNIVNLAMNLRGGGENGATLEILKVDLYTGFANLAKAGGGTTLVFNKNNMERYEKDSLPVGVVKDVKYTVDEFTLTCRDTVVLMSDGIGSVSSNIANLFDKSCGDVAKFAINENKAMDDKTVIALRLETV